MEGKIEMDFIRPFRKKNWKSCYDNHGTKGIIIGIAYFLPTLLMWYGYYMWKDVLDNKEEKNEKD